MGKILLNTTETLFYTDPSVALILIGLAIFVFLFRDKIGKKRASGIIILLIGFIFFGIQGLIRMAIGAIAGALILDELREKAKEEFYEQD